MNLIDYEKQINNKYRTVVQVAIFLLGIVLAGFLMNHHFKDIGAFITNYKQDKQKVTNLVNQYKSLIINNSQFFNYNQKIDRADRISKLFTRNATILGTVSKIVRTNQDESLRNYFLYFANLPNTQIMIMDPKISNITIQQVSSKVYQYYELVYWKIKHQLFRAQMTFTIVETLSGMKIHNIHSSILPDKDVNSSLSYQTLYNWEDKKL